MRIKTEDLEKTEQYKGQNVYSHIVYADKLLDLAKQAKMERTTSSLYAVCDNLPKVLQKKVSEKQKNWSTFTNTIKTVDLGHIWEGVHNHKETTA